MQIKKKAFSCSDVTRPIANKFEAQKDPRLWSRKAANGIVSDLGKLMDPKKVSADRVCPVPRVTDAMVMALRTKAKSDHHLTQYIWIKALNK